MGLVSFCLGAGASWTRACDMGEVNASEMTTKTKRKNESTRKRKPESKEPPPRRVSVFEYYESRDFFLVVLSLARSLLLVLAPLRSRCLQSSIYFMSRPRVGPPRSSFAPFPLADGFSLRGSSPTPCPSYLYSPVKEDARDRGSNDLSLLAAPSRPAPPNRPALSLTDRNAGDILLRLTTHLSPTPRSFEPPVSPTNTCYCLTH